MRINPIITSIPNNGISYKSTTKVQENKPNSQIVDSFETTNKKPRKATWKTAVTVASIAGLGALFLIEHGNKKNLAKELEKEVLASKKLEEKINKLEESISKTEKKLSKPNTRKDNPNSTNIFDKNADKVAKDANKDMDVIDGVFDELEKFEPIEMPEDADALDKLDFIAGLLIAFGIITS